MDLEDFFRQISILLALPSRRPEEVFFSFLFSRTFDRSGSLSPQMGVLDHPKFFALSTFYILGIGQFVFFALKARCSLFLIGFF